MSKCFWSYNYRLITTVQQHENLQLIVTSQVDQLWHDILTLFARISKPLWLNIRSTGAEVAGGQFHASWVTKTESSWSQVPRPRPRLEGSKTKTKTKALRFQDRDRDSRVPRPRPRLWGSKTETETRGFHDQDQDSEVPRPRPRARLVKTGLETSRDQDSSLENSKSGTSNNSCSIQGSQQMWDNETSWLPSWKTWTSVQKNLEVTRC